MDKTYFINNQVFNTIGCNVGGECPTCKSDDNLYLISLNYHGRYEDDDCYFYYLNGETGEVVQDTWTTRFGCPNFRSYLRMMVPDAHKAGFISDKIYNEFIDARWKMHLNWLKDKLTTLPTFHSDRLLDGPHVLIGKGLNIPVEVTKGRKYRGKGILLNYFLEADGPWVYRNRGHHLMAKVLGEDNKIYDINPTYFYGTVMEEITKKLNDILATNPEDTKELTSIYPYMKVNIDNAIDVKIQRKQDRYNSFKENKMPGLIEWCKSKAPEKSEEEIQEWAEMIFKRKYPMN